MPSEFRLGDNYTVEVLDYSKDGPSDEYPYSVVIDYSVAARRSARVQAILSVDTVARNFMTKLADKGYQVGEPHHDGELGDEFVRMRFEPNEKGKALADMERDIQAVCADMEKNLGESPGRG